MSKEDIFYEDDKVKITYIPEIDAHEFLDKRRNIRGDLGWGILEELAKNCKRIIKGGGEDREIDEYLIDEYLFHKFDIINPDLSDLTFNSQIGVEARYRMRNIANILIKAYQEEQRLIEAWKLAQQ